MSSTLSLNINGQFHRIDADERDTPLLYILRDNLKLKGTRFGCGGGHCGACAVLADGCAIRACETPAWAVAGKSVVTIEGLGAPDRMHPLQQAVLDFQAGQCGYCLSGIIMTAAALVAQDNHPSRDKLAAALERNLCRCGTHTRILDALEGAWRRMAAREGPR